MFDPGGSERRFCSASKEGSTRRTLSRWAATTRAKPRCRSALRHVYGESVRQRGKSAVKVQFVGRHIRFPHARLHLQEAVLASPTEHCFEQTRAEPGTSIVVSDDKVVEQAEA